jgi:hypothetical protein
MSKPKTMKECALRYGAVAERLLYEREIDVAGDQM